MKWNIVCLLAYRNLLFEEHLPRTCFLSHLASPLRTPALLHLSIVEFDISSRFEDRTGSGILPHINEQGLFNNSPADLDCFRREKRGVGTEKDHSQAFTVDQSYLCNFRHSVGVYVVVHRLLLSYDSLDCVSSNQVIWNVWGPVCRTHRLPGVR